MSTDTAKLHPVSFLSFYFLPCSRHTHTHTHSSLSTNRREFRLHVHERVWLSYVLGEKLKTLDDSSGLLFEEITRPASEAKQKLVLDFLGWTDWDARLVCCEEIAFGSFHSVSHSPCLPPLGYFCGISILERLEGIFFSFSFVSAHIVIGTKTLNGNLNDIQKQMTITSVLWQ